MVARVSAAMLGRVHDLVGVLSSDRAGEGHHGGLTVDRSACGGSGVLSGSSGHSLGVVDAWEGTGLKDSSHPIPEFAAGSDAVEPTLHARHDPFALGCQKIQDGVVVSTAQRRPDERQILRRNRERVFVLIPAERRPQVLSADAESALSIEVSPDVETITVVQVNRAAIQRLGWFLRLMVIDRWGRRFLV